MADLPPKQSTNGMWISGVDSSGVETYPVGATADGRLKVDAEVTLQPSSAPTVSRSEGAQLVIDGDTFAINTDLLVVSSTNETDAYLFRNTSETKIIRFTHLSYAYLSEASGKHSHLRIYREPTITSVGTAMSAPVPARKDQVLTTAPISTYHTPTISSRGTLLTYITAAQETIPVTIPFSGGLIMEPGEDWLMTIEPQNTNREHPVNGWFVVEDA